jgi:hypothetical protein
VHAILADERACAQYAKPWMRKIISAAALLLVAPSAGRAQAPSGAAGSDAAVCLGFSFGPWSPPLDWRLAGHEVAVDSAHVPRAPDGRGWATASQGAPAEATLMLFPAWWPVGVEVVLSTRNPAPGDTVSGRATALVADGRREAPTSRIRAWPVPCGRGRP